MKILVSVLFFCATFSSYAFAASSKVCFGSTKSEDTKGVVMLAQIDGQRITLKTLKGGPYNGTFAAYHSHVDGRDGKVYLEYKGENVDYQDVIMVDQYLLQNGTTGLLQIRARGEGFFNAVYVCKDGQ